MQFNLNSEKRAARAAEKLGGEDCAPSCRPYRREELCPMIAIC